MKYETREEFLTDYNRLKSHITERQHNQIAICDEVPFDYYTIAYESLSDCVLQDNLQYSDDDVYDEFFDTRTLKEYLSNCHSDKNVISFCYLRKCSMIIDFDTNTIERDSYSIHKVTNEYLITSDSRVYEV